MPHTSAFIRLSSLEQEDGKSQRQGDRWSRSHWFTSEFDDLIAPEFQAIAAAQALLLRTAKQKLFFFHAYSSNMLERYNQ